MSWTMLQMHPTLSSKPQQSSEQLSTNSPIARGVSMILPKENVLSRKTHGISELLLSLGTLMALQTSTLPGAIMVMHKPIGKGMQHS